jgi:tetratricopeptide repeat protein 30
MKACEQLMGTPLEQEAVQLMAATWYEKGNFFEAKKNLRKLDSADFTTLVNKGCIYFKEGEYDRAYSKFRDAFKISGFNAELFYNLALCVYEKGEYDEAKIYVDEIINQAYKKYPQLEVEEENQVFEPNRQKAAQILRETAVVEAINLKAAIYFNKEQYDQAKNLIKTVPAISNGGIDPVTFHNQAIFFVNENSADSIKKLNHLLRDCLFPPETFQNLLFLYWKYYFYDLASELIQENPKFCQKLIEKDDLEYINTLILQQSDPKKAVVKYQELLNEYRVAIANLKSKYRELPETSKERRSISIKITSLTEKYVAVLTNQAKISWDNKEYANVELMFKESADICDENKVFQVNLAHSVYMQEKNHHEAISYYEKIVNKYKDDLLKCETIVLANLWVCYILTKKNEKAEKLIKTIEEHEKTAKAKDKTHQTFHLCIVNLVIGTLYCSKDMYSFGLKLVIESLKPMNEKLGTDTWYYTKRCLLSYIEKAMKKLTSIDENLYDHLIDFLDSAYQEGKNITTIIYVEKSERHKSTVAYEAKFLKKIFLKLPPNKTKDLHLK